jgi:1-acyl-sn-glycerol-3-phosphate acyltransferase
MRDLVIPFLEALFRLLFTYECVGVEQIPASGPAVVVANHPSYLDPILLSLRAPRPIRFMAWDALFRVPILGWLIRAFGAFPVDVARGKGREAYERAKALLLQGEVVGIFPEGKRSRTGWMEPALREGAARLAWETGAPLVPATITGAFRAWPHFQSLPQPAHIRVRFHRPISPLPFSNLPEEQALPALLAELRQRVERTLLPGVKADLRISVLYRTPSQWPRFYEYGTGLFAALLVFWRTRLITAVLPAYAYLAYLFLDHFFIPQRRIVKWIRTASPLLFLLAYAPTVLRALDLPPVIAGRALAAVLLGAAFAYLYEHGRTVIAFVRGLVAAFWLELGALVIAPIPAGPHVALPLFAAAFAWERRTVFGRYSAPVLAAYAVGLAWLLWDRSGVVGLAPHALAGLIAWLVARLVPVGPSPRVSETPDAGGLGLGLSRRD